MSGHSKWSQIKRKKAITDVQKSRLFSKFSKLIEIAARKGADTEKNLSLKTAIEQARGVNMPLTNIERALKKGSGSDAGDNLTEVIYEAYGQGGVAIIINAITSNSNRTVAEIKHLLLLRGLTLAKPGSVIWLFDKKINNNLIEWAPKNTIKLGSEDELKLDDLLGALDENDDVTEVFTNNE